MASAGLRADRARRRSRRGVAAALAAAALAAVALGAAAPRLADVWRGRAPLDPVAFRIGPLAVRWYGLLITLAFGPAWAVAAPERARVGLSADDLVDLLLLGIPLGLVGARLGFVAQNLAYFAAHPVEVVGTGMSGLSIHGALAGAALAIGLYGRRGTVRPAAVADVAAPSLLVAQAIGRWGNFFNRELVGYPTDRPWGLYVPEGLRPPGYEGAAFFHPAFLYESVLDALGAAALLAYRRRADRQPGELAALYLVLYSAIRFGVEWVRIGRPAALGLTLAQWVSAALAAAGAAWWAALRRRARRPVVQ